MTTLDLKADVKQQEIYKRTDRCIYFVSFYKKYLQDLKYINNFAWYSSSLILSVKNRGIEGRGDLLNGKNLLSVVKVTCQPSLLGYSRKNPNRRGWSHRICRGIEERFCENSRGQVKKK